MYLSIYTIYLPIYISNIYTYLSIIFVHFYFSFTDFFCCYSCIPVSKDRLIEVIILIRQFTSEFKEIFYLNCKYINEKQHIDLRTLFFY